MVIFVELEQLRPQRWRHIDIKRLAQKLPCLPLNGIFSFFGARSQVEALDLRPIISWGLRWRAVVFEEACSEHLVAPADCIDTRLQGINVESSDQTRHFDDVVVVAGRIELAENVDSLLLERQAHGGGLRGSSVHQRS